MGIKSLSRFSCDICGISKTQQKLPDGWIQITIDDLYEDRLWHEKVICGDCTEKIINEKNTKITPTS